MCTTCTDIHEGTEALHGLEDLQRFRQNARAWMHTLGYPKKLMLEIELPLGEALVNAFRHGNHADSTKAVTVSYRIEPAGVAFRVSDEGPGFDPRAVPDPTTPEGLERPSGRGLHLMEAFM